MTRYHNFRCFSTYWTRISRVVEREWESQKRDEWERIVGYLWMLLKNEWKIFSSFRFLNQKFYNKLFYPQFIFYCRRIRTQSRLDIFFVFRLNICWNCACFIFTCIKDYAPSWAFLSKLSFVQIEKKYK